MNWNNPFFVLAILAASSTLLPLICALKRRQNLDQGSIILLMYLGFVFVEETVYISLALSKVNNMWLAHIYNVVESIAFISYFYFVLPKGKWQQGMPLLLIVCLLLALVDVVWIGNIQEASLISRPVNCMVYALLSLYYLNHLTGQKMSGIIMTTPHFWFNVAILFRFSGIFLVTLFLHYLMSKYPQYVEMAWYINNILYLSFNILLAIGYSKWKYQIIY